MKRLAKRPAKRRKPVEVPASYDLEPLDPWLMCGPDTSVSELWRVVESRGRERVYHLVFLDRYGWYCEHGKGCPAVAEVRKVIREMTANAASAKTTARRRERSRK